MFKRTLAMIAGVMLLATAATDSRAAGLTLDAGLQAEASPFLTIDPFALSDPFDPLSGVGGLVTNFGLFEFSNASAAGDLVSISETLDLLTFTSIFSLEVSDNSGTVSKLTGTNEDLIFMEDTSGDDLIEILFSVTGGSLSTAPFVLASITGEFGSDPFGTSGTSTLFALGDPAKITLTNVSQIPLPAGMVLLLTALGGLVLVRRRTA